MKRDELRQSMITCIATLELLNGKKPAAEELYFALGTEYAELLAEYLGKENTRAAA